VNVWRIGRINNPYGVGGWPEVYYKVYKLIDDQKEDTENNRYYMQYCAWPTREGAEKAAEILNRKGEKQ
jgi:hypothetical protein